MKNPSKRRPVTEEPLMADSDDQNSTHTISLSAENVQVITLTTENLDLLLERIRGHQVVPAILQRKQN